MNNAFLFSANGELYTSYRDTGDNKIYGARLVDLLDDSIPELYVDVLMEEGDGVVDSADGARDYLYRFQMTDRRLFREAQDLIPLVEDAFEVLSIASSAPERVLRLPGA